MKRLLIFAVPVCVLLLSSCTSELIVQQTSVSPAELKVGEQGLITVSLKGPKDGVQKVIATVREESSFTFPLNDSGTDGDVKAGDNIWSYQIAVPYEAPPGTYNVEISVYDKDGNELVVEGYENQYYGKSGALAVKVL